MVNTISDADRSTSPRKSLGFVTLITLEIAHMIGAGIFTTSGFALADLGSANRVMAAWIVGGINAAAGAIGYGMLSSPPLAMDCGSASELGSKGSVKYFV